jgi:CarD family transcriptional regulator
MIFQVGDQVIHRVHGPGKIIQLDEKTFLGQTAYYYVVQIRDLILWVQVNDSDARSLRLLTPVGDFEKLFAILRSPGQPLPTDRLERKTELADQLKDGKLSSVCTVVRDLTFHSKTQKMNENDKAVLERAENFLLNEWAISLSISVSQARHDINQLLNEDNSKGPQIK